VECARLKASLYAKKNPEKVRSRYSDWYAANGEKRNAQKRERYRENADEARAYARDWRAKNPEKAKAAMAAWREKNKNKEEEYRIINSARINARRSAYKKANPEKEAAYCRNRKARKKKAEGCHNGEDIQRIFEAQNGKCACCKIKVGKKYHVDHITPLSRGGSNWPSNLQILCPTCNTRKHAKDPIEFMRSRGMLL
jgi:5-methylcytosine-specific restriction endonuclease McrA